MKSLLHRTGILGVLLVMVLLLSAGSTAQAGEARQDPEPVPVQVTGPVVARVYFQNQAELESLANSLDIWEAHREAGYLVAMLTPSQYGGLLQDGYRVVIDQNQTAQLNQPHEPLPGQTEGIPGYPCYRTVEETYSDLSNLAATHPNLAAWADIGDSWEKMTPGGQPGYDIMAMILTNSATPEPKPAFFLMGEIHAREYTTAETATRFTEYLVNQYGTNPDITWLLDYFSVHVVPMTNPDGRKFAEQGYSWRKNTDNDDGCNTSSLWGTDLNRNHTFHWNEGGSSNNPCYDTYHGPSAGSEPEVQTVQNYILSLFPDQRGSGDNDPAPSDTTGLMISLHSYSELVLWPYGFRYTQAPNHTQLQTLGRKFAFYNGYTPQQAIQLYPTSGTSDDWAYGTLGIGAYTFEMGTSFFQSCTTFESQIYPTNLQALLYAAKAARRPYQSPAGPDILNVNIPAAVISGSNASLSALANNSRYSSGEPIENVTGARYSIDAPSWKPGASLYPMVATDGSFNSPVENVQASVSTAGLSLGRHTIFVEAGDAAFWGVPSAANLCVAQGARGVEVSPASASAQANPGQSVSYTLRVDNRGASNDTFNLTLAGNNWQTTAPASAGPFSACSGGNLSVTVTIPPAAYGLNMDVVTATLTSQADNTIFDQAVLTTTATPVFGLSLSPEVALHLGDPGEAVTYTLQVGNTGNLTDTYAIEVSGNNWAVAAPASVGPLGRGTFVDVVVSVTIPASTHGNDQDTAQVMLHSISPGGQSAASAALLTTRVRPVYNLVLSANQLELSGPPGSTVQYKIGITNTGNLADSFLVAVAGNSWTTTVPPAPFTLGPGEAAVFDVTVDLPAGAPPGMADTALVTVTSQGQPSIQAQVTLTTRVGWRMHLPLIK